MDTHFSFADYVQSQDEFCVTGTMTTYFQDDAFFDEMLRSHGEMMAFYGRLAALRPRAETAIARFIA